MSEAADWAKQMAPYEQPRLGRGALDIATSVVPYLALVVAIEPATAIVTTTAHKRTMRLI